MKIRLNNRLFAMGLGLLLTTAACQRTPDSVETAANDGNYANDTVLSLAKEGVFVSEIDLDSSQLNPFGSDIEQVKAEVSKAIGKPMDVIENFECEGGPLTITTWSDDFSVLTMENNFVGWLVRADTPTLRTPEDIGIGSTLAELQLANAEDPSLTNTDVKVFESSLGTEFSLGQLGGLLSSNAPDAEIVSFWGGQVCAVL